MRTTRRLAVLAAIALIALPSVSAGAAYEPQITNSQDASPGEYPYMVGLLRAGNPDRFQAQYCGGSLIAADWVLTAAHCLSDGGVSTPAGELDLLIGSIDLSATDGELIPAAQVLVHPGYDEFTMANDIALVQLSTPSTLGTPIAYAGPADTTLEAAGTTTTLTGWGGLTTDQSSQTYAIVLQEASMPIIDPAACDIDGFDPAGMLCAGAPESDADGGIDACQGDSGGPLVVATGTGVVQLGIVSFGPTCGFTPTAYTRVSQQTDFILQSMGGDVELEHVVRIAGSSRYATAATLATERFGPGVPAAFVVTGTNYPDALAAAPAAAAFGGPVLLTARDELPFETATALQALAPGEIFLVGGTGAVSDAVVSELSAYTPGGVTRIAGVDRYSTAVQLAQLAYPGTVDTVYLASGEGFADALAGAALAARFGGPLLLTPRDVMAPVTGFEIARLLGIDVGMPVPGGGVVVFGGAGAVSDVAIEDLVVGYGVALDSILRMAGNDRYETSAYIAGVTGSDIVTGEPITGSEIVVATGANFPDGLVAGSLGEPLFLVPAGSIPATTEAVIAQLQPAQALVMGGTGAVSDAQAMIIDGLLSGAVG